MRPDAFLFRQEVAHRAISVGIPYKGITILRFSVGSIEIAVNCSPCSHSQFSLPHSFRSRIASRTSKTTDTTSMPSPRYSVAEVQDMR
jgi:hypothetical protein